MDDEGAMKFTIIALCFFFIPICNYASSFQHVLKLGTKAPRCMHDL